MKKIKKQKPVTVYFTASITGKKHYLENYLKIINHLKFKNCHVISDHIINSTESEVKLEKKEDRIKFHKQLEKWIKGSDFIVAETTFLSISIGYEISLALNLNKPVLILYSSGNPPTLLIHYRDERVVCEKYSPETLSDIIDDYIYYVKGTADTRFTFFITPEIATFLKKLSRIDKIPKSVYLRKLIEKDMEKRT
ncbi:hypothetical protein A3D05_03605 [Candidatus Gottesmanbacteria bacterium RIFCSPHIGHO2_02_FULL_40_24]|uniref:Predicted DNA-binding protein ribbon-helix-helix domain-containing protein n=1 Tax=Candidatus Gottesmanbacteria bacterium RIFCSPHIGHO2_01_FULL_40_15 TaxID=1798376 RepID=A0A1F5Z281_9BACT|nr:MAG: hypothetical protein A2777_06490 [Candidatus Gottesmanbacteria bacterium RIFCSPHIGHO2_01_FULL_40_15]OGG16965.1 MAG: hypothetical protein A3D05_03605 [Candidatus Gottesmanbacteria bacterium RIFCSPHIGHO2_02_FULL_40_24]OGG20986.1 MAG: hypothetical protein A3B48_01480 [Candidatus Gottesmanbacteria bacterium RIFCSPLOWO2_01_FULL_40_10]OGG23354.1 MAG: hypothetical protein A3E42_03095 [Candidatus Gottesmanbacteria bacterium RIFCSPHIGHO2_12_FULL_40_13]OGG34014.1 MAG: hypothetical protein A3I80_0